MRAGGEEQVGARKAFAGDRQRIGKFAEIELFARQCLDTRDDRIGFRAPCRDSTPIVFEKRPKVAVQRDWARRRPPPLVTLGERAMGVQHVP